MTTNLAPAERAALCDLFDAVGPDAPTLCTGWTTRDLAAHLAVRDRRADAAAGIMIRRLAGHTETVRRAEAARAYPQIVQRVRRVPWWVLTGHGVLDRLTNTTEFYIHHEDVRRAADDWAPRDLSDEMQRALYGPVRTISPLRLRRFPAAITIEAPGYGQIKAGAGGPELSLAGEPGELALFLGGRQAHSRVTLYGPDDLVTRLRTARLGV
jgi:uncharacterized protein (TIGR03085 family)